MVEGSGLENRQGRKSFVSSNLTHAVTPQSPSPPTPGTHALSRVQLAVVGDVVSWRVWTLVEPAHREKMGLAV